MEEIENSEEKEAEESSPEEIAAAKRRARINAAILAGVLLIATLAPPPWSAYAPFLLLIPVVYAIADRLKRTGQTETEKAMRAIPETRRQEPPSEPYSYTPRDPNDPRRYKPIE